MGMVFILTLLLLGESYSVMILQAISQGVCLMREMAGE